MPIMDNTYEAPMTRGSDDGRDPLQLNSMKFNETLEEVPLRISMKMDNKLKTEDS